MIFGQQSNFVEIWVPENLDFSRKAKFSARFIPDIPVMAVTFIPDVPVLAVTFYSRYSGPEYLPPPGQRQAFFFGPK